MTKWPESFSKSEHASLQALGPELVPLLAEGSAAAAGKKSAERQRDEFRDLGARKRFIDRVNAARKEAYGSLSTLPHKHTGLPSSFADQFFRRDTTAGEVDEEPTIEEIEQEVASLRAQLEERERLLDQLKEAATQAATREQERAAAEAKLAQLEQEMADKQREAEAIRAELAKKKG
jgi:chromosome segregation ATPase